jgi:hypothetical protein
MFLKIFGILLSEKKRHKKAQGARLSVTSKRQDGKNFITSLAYDLEPIAPRAKLLYYK